MLNHLLNFGGDQDTAAAPSRRERRKSQRELARKSKKFHQKKARSARNREVLIGKLRGQMHVIVSPEYTEPQKAMAISRVHATMQGASVEESFKMANELVNPDA